MQQPLVRLFFRFLDKIFAVEAGVLALISVYCWKQGITSAHAAGDPVFFAGVVVTLMGLAAIGAGGMRSNFQQPAIGNYYRSVDTVPAGASGLTAYFRTLSSLPGRAVWTVTILLCGVLTIGLGVWLTGQDFSLPWG